MTNQEEIVRLEAQIATLNQELATMKGINTLKAQIALAKEQLAQMDSDFTDFKKYAYTDMIRKERWTIDDVPEDLREEVSARLQIPA